MLSFCDVSNIIQYSYSNRQKYQLVHNTQWLWHNLLVAENAKYGLYTDAHVPRDWKTAFINNYTTPFDRFLFRNDSLDVQRRLPHAYTLDEKFAKFEVNVYGNKISRPYCTSLDCQRYVSKYKIFPGTIGAFAYTLHTLYTMEESHICFLSIGAEPEPYLSKIDVDEDTHHPFVGCHWSLKARVVQARGRPFAQIRCSLKSKDIVKVLVDNGCKTDQVKVTVSINDNVLLTMFEIDNRETYRPVCYVYNGQEVSFKVLKLPKI